MKFYRCDKNILNWTELKQLDYKWHLPILIDKNRNVLLGNSLKNVLPQQLYVVVYNYDNESLKTGLYNIELGLVEENSKDRLDRIAIKLRQFFKDIRKPEIEQLKLFHYKDDAVISEENYILRENSFIKDNHAKRKKNVSVEEEFEIDEEILKELL